MISRIDRLAGNGILLSIAGQALTVLFGTATYRYVGISSYSYLTLFFVGVSFVFLYYIYFVT